MKIKSLTLTLSLFIVSTSFSQVYLAKKWDHTFGGSDKETFTTIIQTSDSGYVLGGFSHSDTGGNVSQHSQGGRDFWIVKTDSTGHKLWDKRYGGTLEDRMFSIDQTTDGGYILGGFTTSDSSGDVSQQTHGSMDYWIVKIDSLGHKIWDKRFGGSDYDQLSTVRQTNDGGYILGGWTYSDSTGDVSQHTRGSEDYWIVKTDSDGNKLWDKRYGGNSFDELTCLQEITGGFILGGVTVSDSSGDVSQLTHGSADFWLVKINYSGTKLWDKRYGGSAGEGMSALQQTSDGGYILGGGTGSDSSGDVSELTRDTSLLAGNMGDFWMIKTDSLGIKQWDKRFGGNWIEGGLGNISQTSDGGYFFGGNSYSNISGDKSENNLGTTQSWIIKTDSAGNKLFDKTLFAPGGDDGGYTIQSGDGCYVTGNTSNSGIGGFKSEMPKGNSDYWFIKFCETEQPQLPVASFSVTNTFLCAGGCFSFMNTSYNAGSFQWYFPGGTPSSSTSTFPSNICYTDSGHYSVTLIAMNTDGNDTLIQPGIVNVLPLPACTITQHADTLFAPVGLASYQWYFNNIVIPNDTNYFHVVTQNGDYRVLVFDSIGCPNSDTVYSVNVNINEFTRSGSGIYVYPLPAKNELNIGGLDNTIGGELIIYDLTGRKIYSKKINSPLVQIRTSGLSPGIYFIVAMSENGKMISRFVKE